jgi:hypothetical protein
VSRRIPLSSNGLGPYKLDCSPLNSLLPFYCFACLQANESPSPAAFTVSYPCAALYYSTGSHHNSSSAGLIKKCNWQIKLALLYLYFIFFVCILIFSTVYSNVHLLYHPHFLSFQILFQYMNIYIILFDDCVGITSGLVAAPRALYLLL